MSILKTDEKIATLREQMKLHGIDMYIIPTNDFHMSEYVGEHFKARAYITGFTGSAGTAVITMKEAHLWTDGRYFIQAARELTGSSVILERMNEPGVLSIKEFIKANLKSGECLGFYGKCMSTHDAMDYFDIAQENMATINATWDLVDLIWTQRPNLPKSTTWVLSPEYAGCTVFNKIKRLREKMAAMQCEYHIISSLYDIAYLLNLRGNDIEHVPVFLAFLIISESEIHLFTDSSKWQVAALNHLQDNSIYLHAYDDIYDYIKSLKVDNSKVLIDSDSVNYSLVKSLPQAAQLVFAPNPSELMRAVKNETEINNTIEAHIKDGVACTKAIKEIKESIKTTTMTEIDVEDCFYKYRKQQNDFLDLSFCTIAAYGKNAAMMHYSADKNDPVELKPYGFVLVDSGAHYLQGTTDITRTICLGELTQKMKEYYTRVLKGHLRLMSAHFLKGCTGLNLDILARGPLWDIGLDYRCGTGHGVGHILNVHEGPNSFRYRALKSSPSSELECGMITTDEPGVYVEDEFGIRIENELLCVNSDTTEYGQFLGFKTLSVCPIDLEPVIPQMLNLEEKQTLNEYHKFVRQTLKPYLTKEENDWLLKETYDIL